MLFKRRNPADWRETVRVSLWPRRSWNRSTRYILYRLWRVRATPHEIALGCSAGVFASFTPFMGTHFLIAGMIAWLTRTSIIASAFGTFIGNPLTFPFIWISAYQLGNWILGERSTRDTIHLSSSIFESSFERLWPLIKPMTVGGIPLGVLAGAVSYYLVRKAVEAYRAKRGSNGSITGKPGQPQIVPSE